MRTVDIPVWEAWLEENSSDLDTVDYDLHLGEGIPPLEGIPSEFQQDWTALTQKRADAVVFRQDKIEVIEVKDRVSPQAIGKVMVNSELLKENGTDGKKVEPVIVARSCDPDCKRIADKFGIRIDLVL